LKSKEIAVFVSIAVLAVIVAIQFSIINHIEVSTSHDGVTGPQSSPESQGPPEQAGPLGQSLNYSQNESRYASIFKKVENSVVQITSTVTTVDNNFIINGMPLQSQQTRLGSGFVYDNQGRIITNNHVVQGSKTVDVTFADENTYRAKVIGTDPYGDIAVIQLEGNFSSENLVPLILGNSSQLQVGQEVVAVGNPFGLSDTITNGIISQIGRILPNTQLGFSIPDVIQTNAAINPGNSGGPLLDLQDRVIGMNTAIKTDSGDFAGIGFVIPSNDIAKIVPYLIRYGTYSHPWLGISGANITPEFAQIHGLPVNYHGVIVENVVNGGPADKAGLLGVNTTTGHNSDNGSLTSHGLDIIIAIDGHPVKSMTDIITYIYEHKSVGDKVTLTVDRDGKVVNFIVTLEARPTS
jgi:S1-C subfamily serine protease